MQRYAPQPTAELVSHVTQILGEAGELWLSELPDRLAELERQWDFVTGDVFAAGEFNFVAAAIRNGSEPVVIKIAPPYPDQEARSEALYMRYKNGNGCVRLLKEDRSLRAILLERAVPGLNLAEIFPGDVSAMIGPGVDVLKSIAEPEPPFDHERLSLDRWFAGLEDAAEAEFPPAFAERALEFYEGLKSERDFGYLHGDFHPGNIVSSNRSPYLAIDGKGVVGHVGYDISVYLNNLFYVHKRKSDLDDAVCRFAAALDLSEADVRRWAYAGWVLGKWWSFKDMPGSYVDDVAHAEYWFD